MSGAKKSSLNTLPASVLAKSPMTVSNMALGMAEIVTKILMLESIWTEIPEQACRLT